MANLPTENCSTLLKASLKRAKANLGHSFLHDEKIAARVLAVVNCPSNRAGVRLLLSCMLAKVHRPEIDPRKPYTKIGTKDCFSGRSYDERFIGDFITKYNLPCNSTTAFLTPTLRHMDQVLTTKLVLVGRPMAMYRSVYKFLMMSATEPFRLRMSCTNPFDCCCLTATHATRDSKLYFPAWCGWPTLFLFLRKIP